MSTRGSIPKAIASIGFAIRGVVAAMSAAGCAHAPPPPDASLLVRAPPRSQLFVDDLYAGLVRPAPIALHSGFHRLEVRAEGRLSAYREVTLRPGERATIAVELRPDLDAPGPP